MDITMRRVFRDYQVLMAGSRVALPLYEEAFGHFGFQRIETLDDEIKFLKIFKKMKPNLVVLGRDLQVQSGLQLLQSARQEGDSGHIPFLIVGNETDFDEGGLADQVGRIGNAALIDISGEQARLTETVLALLDPLIDQDQEKAYTLMDEAAEQAKAGKTEEAVESYRKALDIYGRKSEPWGEMARLLASLGRYDEAEDAYLTVLTMNQYSLTAYFGLAELYESREDFDQSIGLLQQALGVAQLLKSSNQSLSKINFYIGEFELRLKRLSQAEESFTRAIELCPDDSQLRIDIGDAYSNRGHWAESEPHYEAANDIDPNVAHVFNKLGIAYRRQQKFDKALQLYGDARAHRPEDEHLLFNIARTYYESGNLGAARSTLEEAISLSPDFRIAKQLLKKLRKDDGQVQLDNGD